ncbi:MAG TPA: c-type cytochrome biogenesis protein CcmI, partial [Burkholderiales bacterium]|nr:c-type cytochrome biogenesis protein CcmI [Burkholderiales bacterium]
MTAFWITAAVLAAAVLAFLFFPRKQRGTSRRDVNVSVYRDQLRELDADLASGALAQADYERARREIEARVLEDVAQPAPVPAGRPGRGPVVALAMLLPVAALGLYFAIGNPAALNREAEHAMAKEQIESMVDRLAARLRENPDDADGWKLLG